MTKKLEILLVEDNEGDVEMTLRAMRDMSCCNVSVANDGVEALDLLNKRENFATAPTPNLIMLDLNMPRMDGRQFLENVKSDQSFKCIPVVMFTSSQSAGDIRACYERHASAYVVKPFDGKEFSETVRKVAHFWSDLSKVSQ